jgi:hypothetical protein
MNEIAEHIPYVIELRLTVAIGIVNAVIDDPVFTGLRIHIHAVHHADALDQSMGVPTILAPYQFDPVRVILVEHGVVKQHAAVRMGHDLRAHVVPNQAWRQTLGAKVAGNCIVAHVFNMIGKIGQRVVGRARQQVLNWLRVSL